MLSHARAAAAAHEAISPEVGHFKSCHLAGNLPKLRYEKDERPRELESGPCGDGYEEGVCSGDCAEIGWENT